MLHLIVSVGTSFLMNAVNLMGQDKKILKEMPLLGAILKEFWVKKETPQKLLGYLEDKFLALVEEGHEVPNEELVNELAYLLTNHDNSQLSAEISTLKNLPSDIDWISTRFTLLASDTYIGQLCARVLQRYLGKKKFDTKLQVISGLSYDPGGNSGQGLIAFTNLLIALIEPSLGENEEVALVVTGGFKSQIVYSAIIAMLYHIPIAYFNELFLNTIFLPPLPLKLDAQFWNDYKDVLLWFQQPRTAAEIREKLKAVPPALTFFLEPTGDNAKQLSPLGKILVMLYKSPVHTSYT